MSVNYSNIKLLFIIRNNENIENNEYIFLISEDKYQYTIASYNYRYSTYIVFTYNKITHDLEYDNQDFLIRKKLTDIIKGSKNIKEFKCADNFVYKHNITTHTINYIRNLKIENIIR